MRFSEQLRQEAEPVFQAIYHHPFVHGIARGELRKEQLIHYVKQDFEYLNVYMNIYGLAISKCRDRRDIAMFHNNIGFILNSEVHPHNNLCRVAGVRYEDLQGYRLAPTALHYTRHMLTVAHQGTLGEIYAVLLPCPWTYIDAAQYIIETVKPGPDHPFYEWIMFYGDETVRQHMTEMIERLDVRAEEANEEERARMKEHFMLSCQLEYMFFDMAYKLEEWPITI